MHMTWRRTLCCCWCRCCTCSAVEPRHRPFAARTLADSTLSWVGASEHCPRQADVVASLPLAGWQRPRTHRSLHFDMQNLFAPALRHPALLQMVSLLHLADITEEGVTFSSPADGSRMLLTPEHSIRIQNQIGPPLQLQRAQPTLCRGFRVQDVGLGSRHWRLSKVSIAALCTWSLARRVLSCPGRASAVCCLPRVLVRQSAFGQHCSVQQQQQQQPRSHGSSRQLQCCSLLHVALCQGCCLARSLRAAATVAATPGSRPGR